MAIFVKIKKYTESDTIKIHKFTDSAKPIRHKMSKEDAAWYRRKSDLELSYNGTKWELAVTFTFPVDFDSKCPETHFDYWKRFIQMLSKSYPDLIHMEVLQSRDKHKPYQLCSEGVHGWHFHGVFKGVDFEDVEIIKQIWCKLTGAYIGAQDVHPIHGNPMDWFFYMIDNLKKDTKDVKEIWNLTPRQMNLARHNTPPIAKLRKKVRSITIRLTPEMEQALNLDSQKRTAYMTGENFQKTIEKLNETEQEKKNEETKTKQEQTQKCRKYALYGQVNKVTKYLISIISCNFFAALKSLKRWIASPPDDSQTDAKTKKATSKKARPP